MAISVDYATLVITVPQADLTFVSGTLYEHDTNAFRLALKDWEDDSDGMAMERTHRHNTEVTVAGTTFARTFEIINGYSVAYEDTGSQYSVRLAGSNNNIFDVESGILVQNGVQVIAQNSAGLVNFSAISPAAIGAAVWDVQTNTMTLAGSIGQFVNKKLLRFTQFVGLK